MMTICARAFRATDIACPSKPFSTSRRNARSVIRCEANYHAPIDTPSLDRRALLLGMATMEISLLSSFAPLSASAAEYETFYGMATPPTSYGGYGGNDPNAAPKYTFEYPTGWKTAVPNKVEKGTQGIDGRVFNPKNKNQQIVVITFGRAGEDNKSFRVTDIDVTIQGFAGADYDLQDALATEINRTTSEREVNGQKYYDVQIDSPDVQYLVSVTVDMGKVYALFVKSPTRAFKADETALRHVVDTFRTI